MAFSLNPGFSSFTKKPAISKKPLVTIGNPMFKPQPLTTLAGFQKEDPTIKKKTAVDTADIVPEVEIKRKSKRKRKPKAEKDTSSGNFNRGGGINMNFSGNKDPDYPKGSDIFQFSRTEFTNPDTRGSLFYSGQKSKVQFNLPIPSTTHLISNFYSSYPIYGQNEVNPKLIINLANFANGLFNVATTGNTNDALKTVFDRYTKDLMAKVRSNLVSSWTYDNFKNVLRSNCIALEWFYTLDSLNAYVSSSDIKRIDGNRVLEGFAKSYYSFAILQEIDELKKQLKDCWFPPDLSELIRWTYQNYKIGDCEQSPCARFLPSSAFCFEGTLDEATFLAALRSVRAAINTNLDYVKLNSMLVDLLPLGRIVNLPTSSETAVYDSNWLEVFSNQPILFKDTTVTPNVSRSYPVADGNSDIPYYMNVRPDSTNGFPFALQTLNTYVTATGSYTIPDICIFICQTYGDKNCNKFAIDYNPISGSNAITFYPRLVHNYTIGTPDHHTYRLYTLGTEGFVAAQSCPSPGWQRVYFDNKTAPIIQLVS